MALTDTKERALPPYRAQALEDHLVFLKHIALYDFAKQFANQRRVLDLGCGEGYGADELARVASTLIAVDNSVDTITHARRKYTRSNLFFVVCDAQHLPFCDESFDAVVSYEVIEHMEDAKTFLREIKRICHKTVLVSTPNRSLRLLPFQRPWNRFHKREYDQHDFLSTLKEEFTGIEMKGITAIPEIMRIELDRIRQKPWIAYPRMLAQIVLPPVLYERLGDLKAPSRPGRAAANVATEKFSAADFVLTKERLDECINLIAVCESL